MPNIYRTGQRIDHYEIIRPLGQGAASQVYLAQDWQAQREVVLKFPDDEVIGGAAVFERYQRESEIGTRAPPSTHPAALEPGRAAQRRVPGARIPARADPVGAADGTRAHTPLSTRGAAHAASGV